MKRRYSTIRTDLTVDGVTYRGWSVRCVFRLADGGRAYEAVHSAVFSTESAAKRLKDKIKNGGQEPKWTAFWRWVPCFDAPDTLAFMRVAPTAPRHLTAAPEIYATK